jgi:ABC-type protease/lipase transport system fused ATPase/permease subunit
MSIAQGHTQALASRGIISLLSAPSPDDPVTLRLHESARRMIGIAIFSGVVNVLMLSGSLYMLQMYDRVIPSRNLSTLLGLWLRRIRQRTCPCALKSIAAVAAPRDSRSVNSGTTGGADGGAVALQISRKRTNP